MASDGQITYNPAILDHLHTIQQCKTEFDGLLNDVTTLQKNLGESWHSSSNQAFNTTFDNWRKDVTEIQETLSQIIRASTDGVGDMGEQERAVAKSFS
ncbi:WXG100 family type VII secretion target [Williamsia sp. M5A3_1d]